MKGFVLDNYLDPEEIPLDVKREEEEVEEFFLTSVILSIFGLISPENKHLRIFKCNTIVSLNPL